MHKKNVIKMLEEFSCNDTTVGNTVMFLNFAIYDLSTQRKSYLASLRSHFFDQVTVEKNTLRIFFSD